MPDGDHVLEICSGRAAWQVIPTGRVEVNLGEVSSRIVASGWNRTLENRLCHTFAGEVALTLFPSGKLLVKTPDREIASRIARTHIDEWLG